MWKIEKVVSKGDYNYAVVRDHPRRIKYDYVLEHVVVMENYLKRLLNPNEVVHHKDGNKKNNAISNLEVLDKIEHVRLHQLEVGRKYCSLKCPNCGDIFERPENKTHLKLFNYRKSVFKSTFCSAKCRGQFSRKVQLQGLTHEMEKAITENLQKRYRRYLDNPVQTALQQDA